MTDTPTETNTALGISFGNSTTQIAFISRASVPECLANEDGERQIPSILSYSEGEEYHGGQAKSQLVRNSGNTIVSFRDWLGQKFNTINIERAKYSAKPVATESGDVAFNIMTLVEKQTTAPATPSASGTSTPLRTGQSTPLPPNDFEETESVTREEALSVADVITRHLRRIQASAQHYLGNPPQGAVYTVPTNFSHSQREELTACSENAGIPVLQIIHEPSAALLAYHSLLGEATHMSDKKFLILDIGGVRCDSAIIAVRAGMYTILSSHHAHELAPGELLDQAIYNHFSAEFKKKTKLDTNTDARARMKLLLESESVKKSLSASATANASVESLMEGYDFKSSINRTRFDMLGRKIYQQIADFALEAVKKANLEPIDIDDVLLVGGTASLTKLSSILQGAFPAPTTILPILYNTSELVARGAAIQAELISSFDAQTIAEAVHPVVTVVGHLLHPLGVKTHDGKMDIVLEGDSAVPCRGKRVFRSNDGGDIVLEVYEGRRETEVIPTPPTPPPEDEDGDLEGEEPERRRIVVPERKIAVMKVKGVKKGGSVEVQVQVDSEGRATIVAREIGRKDGGVTKGVVEPKAE